MKREMPPNVSFLSGRDTAPAYWMYNILWVPLIEGHQTAGSFSVIEQWMRKDFEGPLCGTFIIFVMNGFT